MSAKTQQPKREKKVYRNNIQSITKPGITRLARQAGVVGMDGGNYDDIRGILKAYLEQVIRDSVIYTENDRRKKVMVRDVINGIESVTGEHVAFDLGTKMKTCKK